ncbi:MAG: DUF3467 domain-containing protein [Patescibacteria group bacterium]|nr:DUF3467 domain-containing protein [Patescibacteria group bacterium]
MAEQQSGAPGGIQVKASEELLKGKYSTHMQVLHTREEFILDFMLMVPPLAQLVSRLLVSPAHFKRLVRALTENLARYEKQYGKIDAGVKPSDEHREVGFQVE